MDSGKGAGCSGTKEGKLLIGKLFEFPVEKYEGVLSGFSNSLEKEILFIGWPAKLKPFGEKFEGEMELSVDAKLFGNCE